MRDHELPVRHTVRLHCHRIGFTETICITKRLHVVESYKVKQLVTELQSESCISFCQFKNSAFSPASAQRVQASSKTRVAQAWCGIRIAQYVKVRSNKSLQ